RGSPITPPRSSRRLTIRRSTRSRRAPSIWPRSVPPGATNPVTSPASLVEPAPRVPVPPGRLQAHSTVRMTNTILTLHDPAAARRYYAEGLWRDDTLYALLAKHAAERPEAFALRDATRRLTWAALREMVDAVAGDLHQAGLKRGERVAVWLPNRVEAATVLLACSRQGYACNPSLHQNYTVAEIVELLGRTRAAALFA